MRLFIFLMFCVFILNACESYRILGVFPVAGKSHYTAGSTLLKILAEKGHEVVMISAFSEKNPPENFKNVVLSQDLKGDDINFFDFNIHPYLQAIIYSTFGVPLVNSTLSHPNFKQLLNPKQKFDLIILESFYSDGLRYLSQLFNAPMILFSSLDSGSWTNPSFGNSAPIAYVIDPVVPSTDDLSLLSRIDRSIIFVLNEIVRNFLIMPNHDKLVKQHFPEAGNIEDYWYNASIVLLNADLSVNNPVPKVPGMIDIGGFHIKPPKPLPHDLQVLLDDAKNGVIYFSMGSNLKSTQMPKETLRILMKVFASLKETILWKWEDDSLPGKPDNVVTRKWLPQNDIFAHKNIKLFITHGGIFSTMEAVYHGIPCLAFPIFGDQSMNAEKATSNGYAKSIEFHSITEKNLRESISELLSNPSYAENAKKRSLIMRDKQMTPAEKLVYWVEYAIRHKGAPHLRVAALKLHLYQYLLLDVILFVIFCSVISLFIIKFISRTVLRAFRKKEDKVKFQ